MLTRTASIAGGILRAVFRGTLPAGGPTLDAALGMTAWKLRLYHATPTSRWHPFAEVALRMVDDQDDEGLRFDSVRHPLPGAAAYSWVAALRQPSYELVQPARPHQSWTVPSSRRL